MTSREHVVGHVGTAAVLYGCSVYLGPSAVARRSRRAGTMLHGADLIYSLV